MQDAPTRLFGLIGFPLAHSFSKKFFSEKFDAEGLAHCRYELFPMESPEGLEALLAAHPQLEGLNVTIPHKEAVIPLLDHLDDEARQVGAVNTIKIRGGKLIGFNTDVYGFEFSLRDFVLKSKYEHPTGALILGTGGASKAVAFVLGKMGIRYHFVSRKKKPGTLTYKDLTASTIAAHQLLVNTTPLGTYPKVEECLPIPYEQLDDRHLLFDLVYNPGKTLFLANGERQGCQICNGLRMLELQAERAWEIWNS